MVHRVGPTESGGEEQNRPPGPTPQKEVPADRNHQRDEQRVRAEPRRAFHRGGRPGDPVRHDEALDAWVQPHGLLVSEHVLSESDEDPAADRAHDDYEAEEEPMRRAGVDALG